MLALFLSQKKTRTSQKHLSHQEAINIYVTSSLNGSHISFCYLLFFGIKLFLFHCLKLVFFFVYLFYRPGRPPKRSSGIPSPEPGNYTGNLSGVNSGGGGHNASNALLPLLGFGSNTKKSRYSDEIDFATESKSRPLSR